MAARVVKRKKVNSHLICLVCEGTFKQEAWLRGHFLKEGKDDFKSLLCLRDGSLLSSCVNFNFVLASFLLCVILCGSITFLCSILSSFFCQPFLHKICPHLSYSSFFSRVKWRKFHQTCFFMAGAMLSFLSLRMMLSAWNESRKKFKTTKKKFHA